MSFPFYFLFFHSLLSPAVLQESTPSSQMQVTVFALLHREAGHPGPCQAAEQANADGLSLTFDSVFLTNPHKKEV